MGELDQNSQNAVYLSLLEKSLEKKTAVLEKLIELTGEQESLINNDRLKSDQFSSIIEEKDKLINQINELDDGFEQLYQRVREELNINPGSHRTQIEKLKRLITEITDKGVSLQVMERRNKDKIDNFIRSRQERIRNFKVNSKTAAKYYSNFNKTNADSSFFFDKRN